MSELRQFKLPDVGEGLTEADIVRWHVQPGDAVKVNQIIVEIETAKAVVELPSPHAGTVSKLLVAEGDTVDVGTPIISISTGAAARPDPRRADQPEHPKQRPPGPGPRHPPAPMRPDWAGARRRWPRISSRRSR